MALNERDNHSYKLPEAVKEARIRNIQRRFEKALPQKKTFRIDVPIPETTAGWTILCVSLASLTALLITALVRIL